MGNPDDIHLIDKGFEAALKRLDIAPISQKNKELISAFIKDSKKKGNRKSTYTNDLNITLRMALFYKKDLDIITVDDYDNLIEHLESQKKTDYNYRKITKKFFRWLTDDNPPKWIR